MWETIETINGMHIVGVLLVLGLVYVALIRITLAQTNQIHAVKSPQERQREREEETERRAREKKAFTLDELKRFTGQDGTPIYIAVQDPFSDEISVFDMSRGVDFYGPGGPYNVFAGRHASYALGKTSTDPNQVEGDLSTLSYSEKDTMAQWYLKFASKYPKIGYLVLGEDSSATSVAASEAKKDL